MLNILQEDFRRIPEPMGREEIPESEPEPPSCLAAAEPAVQLGLF